MKTVRITLAMAIALLIAIPVMAQEKKAAKGKRAQLSQVARVMLRMGKLREALTEVDLTAEQKESLDKVREELGPKMKEAFTELKEIFTEEQRTAVEEASKQAKEAGKEGRAMMLAIESALKLTDEQKEKVDKAGKEVWVPLSRKMNRKVMAILTPEQKEKVKKAMAPKARKQRKPGDKKDKPRAKKNAE